MGGMKTLCSTSLILILSFLLSHSIQARWAETGDADVKIKSIKRTYTVRKDGTFKLRMDRTVEIMNEQGRSTWGLTRMNYDAVMQKFNIVEAATLNGKKRIPVPKGDIEIKPLASSGPGFNSTNQVTIAFPEVNVGSILKLVHERDEMTSSVPGLFGVLFELSDEYFENFEIELNSEIPIFLYTHDPEGYLKIKQEPKRIQISLAKPYFKRVEDEPDHHADSSDFIWIGMSSIDDLKKLPTKTLLSYESAINQELPKKFQKILESAKTFTDPVQVVNHVTSELAETVRYVGDWRAVKSGFHPRSLKEIERSKFGDCKDFTVSTGAILQRLGFKVTSAWVFRGVYFSPAPMKNPVLDVNHAILYAEKDGKVFWIDPTNKVSYAQGIFPDIADRPAVILDPKGPYELNTPRVNHDSGEIVIDADLDFSAATEMKAKGKLELKGRAALAWAGAELSSHKKSIDNKLVRWVANADLLQDYKVSDYSLTSRLVQDLAVDFQTRETWYPLQTSTGTGFLLPGPHYFSHFRFRRDEKVSGLRLANPVTLKRNLRIRGREVLFNKASECRGESPWADFDRKIQKENGVVQIRDSISLKSLVIRAKDVQSQEFQGFQNSILQCLQESVMIFK